MTETASLERLTASDIFLLLWDDYGWATDIGGLAVLDGTNLLDREGRVRIEEIRRRLAPRLNAIPRFRQLLKRPSLGLGWPLWDDAPSFDIAEHWLARAQLVRAAAEDAVREQEAAEGEAVREEEDPHRELARRGEAVLRVVGDLDRPVMLSVFHGSGRAHPLRVPFVTRGPVRSLA